MNLHSRSGEAPRTRLHPFARVWRRPSDSPWIATNDRGRPDGSAVASRTDASTHSRRRSRACWGGRDPADRALVRARGAPRRRVRGRAHDVHPVRRSSGCSTSRLHRAARFPDGSWWRRSDRLDHGFLEARSKSYPRAREQRSERPLRSGREHPRARRERVTCMGSHAVLIHAACVCLAHVLGVHPHRGPQPVEVCRIVGRHDDPGAAGGVLDRGT